MRIRKRQVLLPLSSSLSPVPLSSSSSDPHFNRSPVVQLHNSPDPHKNHSHQSDHSRPQPSDQLYQPIGTADDADAVHNRKKMDCLVSSREEESGRMEGIQGERSNDTRDKSISLMGAEMDTGGVFTQSSSSRQAVGRWFDGDKAIPLKKRRGSFERIKVNDETSSFSSATAAAVEEKADDGNKKMKTRMKTKMNKKLNDVVKKETSKANEGGNNAATGKKRSGSNNSNRNKRGGAIMEGSRCSRVNGRGWRCCQQTLVGYSLCEHHLGKGRLRSITSVRSRPLQARTNNTPASSISITPPLPPTRADIHHKKNETKSFSPAASSSSSYSIQQSKPVLINDHHHDEDDDDEKPLMKTTSSKKRMKLGMVKARSISSLLGQTNNGDVVIVANNNNS